MGGFYMAYLESTSIHYLWKFDLERVSSCPISLFAASYDHVRRDKDCSPPPRSGLGSSWSSAVSFPWWFHCPIRHRLCRRRGWRDPLYETYKSSSGFTCLVLVNGREYQTDLAYESDGLAQENAAMRAFMVCRNFSVNGGMLARNGVVQGLPASESSGRHKRSRGGRSHSVNLSSSSSTTSSE
ncbi:hypothetical protein JHW43_008145 [Diplocarpon mali]|nr:hypothetical protein JHW43_008145 [Diplocarpon mali]